jgi:succinoglycan biosynthesis protein ExoA
MEQRSEETAELVRDPGVTISVVIATYNEERHIGTCLDALLRQCAVPGKVEIIVVDGMSRDRTRAIVKGYADRESDVRLIENPRRLQVYAWNAGWRAARGRYVALMSAHAEYSTTYLATCLEVLQRTGAAGVGGVQTPYGESALGDAIAWAMSSPFGMGNARFRYAKQEEESDSIFGIFTTRDVLERVGGFDERVAFDEDAELNYRIRSAGGKLVVSPAIGVRYHVRESLHALGKQMFRYGYWRRYTQLLHPAKVPLRVYAPAALVLGFAASAVLALTPARIFAALLPAAYAAFLAAASGAAMVRIRWRAALVPVSLCVMHFSYGFGWWRGLLAFQRARPGAPLHTVVRTLPPHHSR